MLVKFTICSSNQIHNLTFVLTYKIVLSTFMFHGESKFNDNQTDQDLVKENPEVGIPVRPKYCSCILSCA